jgi:CHAT domain-containing protein
LRAAIGLARSLVPKQFAAVGALIGSTLMALSLVGSYGSPANPSKHSDTVLRAEVARLHELGKSAFSEGRYQDAREAFRAGAAGAARAGSPRDAAMNWSNAGFSSVAAMQYGAALQDLTRARETAETAREPIPLAYALNNLASLYLQMGAPDRALRIARDAMSGFAGHADAGMRGKLFYQEAQALATLGRFPEAEPIFRQALGQIMDAGDLDAAARCWAGLGSYYLDAGRYPEAEWALSEALRLVRTHHLQAATNVLTNLAKLRGKQGDSVTAEHLFQEALDAHESISPLWTVYYDRGVFRLAAGKPGPALEDFREARRLAVRIRAGIVPADQDRVGVENRVNRLFEGLVDAGNRLAAVSQDRGLFTETFDAAEQDRLWSLRSIVPDASDWRSRLPSRYWELLARFQSAEGSLLARPSAETEKQAADLEIELQHEEAAAGANPLSGNDGPSKHVGEILDSDSVLLSFSITDSASWLWVVEGGSIAAYAVPPRRQIQQEVAQFTRILQAGGDSTASGMRLYASLFGGVPAAKLQRKHWLLEPDGPLYGLPFAALPAGTSLRSGDTRPPYLIEQVALETIPGALLLERGTVHTSGSFVGVGDPVFNLADPRYRFSQGRGMSTGARDATLVLPRLPNTAAEVEACAHAWGSQSSQLLTGPAANADNVESALASSPGVIHFATHVVTAPGEFGSGLIALGLDANGAVGLLGPRQIAARPVSGSLVVMNGCHSAQGETLPGSGSMGLTRAWIAAGASAVLSTLWDVPDDTAQALMVNFYGALGGAGRGNPAIALRQAQIEALHSTGPDHAPARWAGYFLLSRI